MAESADGPSFRANKRRKVFRKRAESDTNDDEPQLASLQPSGLVSTTDANDITGAGNENATSRSDVSRVRKPKKHGIAFSSLDRPSPRPHNDNEETTMVISEPQAVEQENGRFTRQTGKAVVEDDKHMCVSPPSELPYSDNFLKAGLTASAWLDSKMADIRKASTTPSVTTQQFSHNLNVRPEVQAQAQLSPASTGRDSTPLSPQPNQPTSTNSAPAANTKPPPSNRRHNRTRRLPSPSTTARASLIDQIMRESNHTPHYTSPSRSAPKTNDSHFDPDAAAAEAFKTEFLAQAEARNLSRRQPAINASSGSAAAGAVPSGPKLGGSRAARERMRAVEEAKGKK